MGDVAGFAAATYQRGIGLVQIPTTLLALVDSSVGGKTAVNHAAGKNLIGAFYQPRAVLADVATLRTLPMREYRAGLAEVVKYGVIADVEFFAWLEAHIDALMARDAAALLHVVRRCCQIKAAVVAADEREQGGRAILNFGHTFGHAIETLTGFRYLHGEAVAVGMAMAMQLSVRLGLAGEGGCQARAAFAWWRGFDIAGGGCRTASHAPDHGHGQESVGWQAKAGGLRWLGAAPQSLRVYQALMCWALSTAALSPKARAAGVCADHPSSRSINAVFWRGDSRRYRRTSVSSSVERPLRNTASICVKKAGSTLDSVALAGMPASECSKRATISAFMLRR